MILAKFKSGPRKFPGAAAFSAVLAVAIFIGGAPSHAQSLKESLDGLVKNHKRIRAAEMDMATAKELIRVSVGDWFPTMDLTANQGYEEQRKGQGVVDTNIYPREFDVTLTQKVWDFGATNAAIRNARLTFDQARENLTATRQSVLLEGITAHLRLISSAQILKFALQSEGNIKRQADIEDSLVQRGSGLSTDVLQAKTQLAGARSRRVQVDGAYKVARNRYRAIFGAEPPEDVSVLTTPRAPVELILETVEEVVEESLKNNPQLLSTKLTSELALENVKKTFSEEVYPTLNAQIDGKWKNDVNGIVGGKQELLLKMEMTKSINLGLTAVNTLRAAKKAHLSKENIYGDARNLVEEQARNAWQNLLTTKENSEFLINQANIAAEFLGLARKERTMGTRSLIDVLVGETALINASSDAESAKTDVKIAVYTVLGVMGQLEADIINE